MKIGTNNVTGIRISEVVTLCVLDVLSTGLLFWMFVAVLGFVRRLEKDLFLLVFSVTASMSIDQIVRNLELWQRPAVAAGLVLLLVILLTLIHKRKEHVSNPATRFICLTPLIAGWVVVFFVPLCVGYGLVRNIPEAASLFSRLTLGTLLLLILFTALTRNRARQLRKSLATGTAAVAGILLVYRVFVWGSIWTAYADGKSTVGLEIAAVAGEDFPRLRGLLEARRALVEFKQNPAGAAHRLRRASLYVEKEWLLERISRWWSHPSQFLLAAAFGGGITPAKDELASCFLLEESVPRFLVATDQGRIIALGEREDCLTRLDFRPIDLSPAGTGDFAALGEKGELCLVKSTGETTRCDLKKGEYRGLAYDSENGSLLVLRPRGSVVRVRGQLVEEFIPTMWPAKELAVDVVTTPAGSGLYVLDCYGGVHPRGKTPITYGDLKEHSRTAHYWPTNPIAVAAQVTHEGFPIYVDAYGGIHGVIKKAGRVTYTGHTYPLLDRPAVVDCVFSEAFSAVYLLTAEGKIHAVPEYGWIKAEQRTLVRGIFLF